MVRAFMDDATRKSACLFFSILRCRLAEGDLADPWFQKEQELVLLGVGRINEAVLESAAEMSLANTGCPHSGSAYDAPATAREPELVPALFPALCRPTVCCTAAAW